MIDLSSADAVASALGLDVGNPDVARAQAKKVVKALSALTSRRVASPSSRDPGVTSSFWRFPMTPPEEEQLGVLAAGVGVSLASLLRAGFASVLRGGSRVFSGSPLPAAAVGKPIRLPLADAANALALLEASGTSRSGLLRGAVLTVLSWSEAQALREVHATPGAVRGKSRAPRASQAKSPVVVRVPKALLAWLPLAPMTGSGRWSLRRRLGPAWDAAAAWVATNPIGPTLREAPLGPSDSVRFTVDPETDIVPASWARGAFERRALGHLLRGAPEDVRVAWLQ